MSKYFSECYIARLLNEAYLQIDTLTSKSYVMLDKGASIFLPESCLSLQIPKNTFRLI